MSEKTLSSKKLRRIQRKQQMEDKNRANTTKSEIKMPKEWQKPPKHLKGREIGLWHRDRKLFLKLLEKNSESFETEKKVSRKEIKSQKKQKRKEETDLQQQCYRIDLDLTRQQKIEEYLSTARESPPSFLLPQHEYHKRIKKKSFKPSKAKSVVESKGSEQLDSSEASLTIDDCLTKDWSTVIWACSVNREIFLVQELECGCQMQKMYFQCQNDLRKCAI